MKIIVTENAPGAIGPYSQGYETDGLVITSGQLPRGPRHRRYARGHRRSGRVELQERGRHPGGCRRGL